MSQNNNSITNGVSSKEKNMALISLVLGILSVVFLFIGANVYIPMALGALGLIFTFLSKDAKGGVRTTGLICSCVGLGIAVIGYASFVAFMSEL